MGGDGDKSADNNNNIKQDDVWRVPKFHEQCLPWTVSKDIICCESIMNSSTDMNSLKGYNFHIIYKDIHSIVFHK